MDASGHNAIEINEWSTLGAEFGKLCHLHRADCGIVNHGMTSAIVMDAFLSRLVRWTTGWLFFGREEHEAQTRQQQHQRRPQSSSASRFTAGASEFFILRQSGVGYFFGSFALSCGLRECGRVKRAVIE
jgi:hypothetical protein